MVLFHPDGERFVEFVEAIQQRDLARTALEEKRQKNQQLLDRLIQLGVNPDNLP